MIKLEQLWLSNWDDYFNWKFILSKIKLLKIELEYR